MHFFLLTVFIKRCFGFRVFASEFADELRIYFHKSSIEVFFQIRRVLNLKKGLAVYQTKRDNSTHLLLSKSVFNFHFGKSFINYLWLSWG